METQTEATTKNLASRDSGVYLILARNADGAMVYSERPDKRAAQLAVKEVGPDNIVAVYRGARKLQLKTEVKVTL